jgi:hypothetical protein
MILMGPTITPFSGGVYGLALAHVSVHGPVKGLNGVIDIANGLDDVE